MRRTMTILLAGLFLGACGDTDEPEPGAEPGPGQEVEEMEEREVEAVQLDTVGWFSEGRTVEFQNRTWIIAGEPIYDPIVERVGEFEGTPLYAEPATTAPSALYIPLGGDLWQRLEATPPPTAAPQEDEGDASG